MKSARPFEFNTIAILYTLLGIVMALVNHFVVLSSAKYSVIFGG